MIIEHVVSPTLKPFLEQHHPDYRGKIIKSPSTYKLVAEHSEYVKNNDVVYYEAGFNASSLKVPISQVLSPEHIEKIRNRQLLLIVDFSLELHDDYVPELYKNLIVRDDIPAEQIVLLAHTLDYKNRIEETAKLYGKPLVKYEYYPYWIRSQQVTFKNSLQDLGANTIDHNNSGLYFKNTQRKFLFLNNNWKEHRITLLCLLQHFNLLDYSYVSFSGKPEREGLYKRLVQSKQPIPQWLEKEQTNTLAENWDVWIDQSVNKYKDIGVEIRSGSNIVDKLPLTLDMEDRPLHIPYMSQTRLMKYYKNTFFSVVTESGFDHHETFITEKVFKAISHKHPFIFCGETHSLQRLQQMGYKTFNNIIDESYDNESDPNKRMLLICREIEKLCKMNETETETFKEQCKPIVEYNFDRFFNEKSFIIKVL